MIIKPISDLLNYDEVLKDCVSANPVYLTENGKSKYVLVEVEAYEKAIAKIKLLEALAEAESDVSKNGWYSIDELEK